MESNTPPPPPSYSSPGVSSASRGIFGSKIPSGVTFIAGILLFLLPFAEIKCNNFSLAQNTGLGIAMGSSWKTSPSELLGNDLFGNTENIRVTENRKEDPNYYAIVALALAIMGLVLSLFNGRAATGAAMVAGILSIAAMIGLWIDLKKKVSDSVLDAQKAGDLSIDKVKVSLELTPWFYIAIIVFLVAAIFCYRRLKEPG